MFRVTVTEAYFFAEWLGGKLPTQKQWFKAAGASLDTTMADEDNTGPFEGLASDPTDLGVNLLATGPLPVGTARRAVSRSGCCDMAGNGFEWLREVQRPVGETVPVDIAVRDTVQCPHHGTRLSRTGAADLQVDAQAPREELSRRAA